VYPKKKNSLLIIIEPTVKPSVSEGVNSSRVARIRILGEALVRLQFGLATTLTGVAGISITMASKVSLSTIGTAATCLLGFVSRTSRWHGVIIDANSLRPGLAVVGVEDIQSTRFGGRGGGWRGKGGQTGTTLLSGVGTLAAFQHTLVGGTIILVSVGQGTVILASGNIPGSIVIGIVKVQSTRARGRGGGGTGELADALSAHLSAVGTLAAFQLRGVVGTIVYIVEGEGEGVQASGIAPGGVVVGVPKVGNAAGGCGRGGGRTG
jgi:hypothetical protein